MRAFVERHFETLDRLLVAAVAVLLFAYGHYVDRDATVLAVLSGNRTAVYGTVTRLFATVFGFGLTSMSIVLAFAQSPRLDVLRRSKQWATMWRVFTQGLGTFIVVAFAGFVGMLVDRDRAPQPLVAYGTNLLLLLGAVRLYRLLWAFKNLVFIMIRPHQSESEQDLRGTEQVEPVSVR
jgi:hypothetical protein